MASMVFMSLLTILQKDLVCGKKFAVVETYMAHHQALILLSINNLINGNVLQDRFIQNPEIKATSILLQERMPSDMLITKEKKEKTKRIKYTGFDNYVQNVYTEVSETIRKSNVLSNEDYLIVIDDKGNGFSRYKDILVNKYKETSDGDKGIFFYIRDTENGKLWKSCFENGMSRDEKYEVVFSPDLAKITRSMEKIETELKVVASSTVGTEIRSIRIKNNRETRACLDICSSFKPVLSKMEDDISHPAFNNLFLKYSMLDNGCLMIKRNKRGNGKELFLGCGLFLEDNESNRFEFEIDESKLFKYLKNGESFSSKVGLVTDPCVALKRMVCIEPGEEVTLNLVLAVSDVEDEVKTGLEYYMIQENVEQEFNISRAKAEEEARYLNLDKYDLQVVSKILPYVMYQNPMRSLYMDKLPKAHYKQSDLWKYAISGDIPIILVKVQNANDAVVVKELLKVHEYLRARGIKTDLVILDYEKNVYEQYVKEQIIQEILNMQIGFLQNVSGGIFLLNSNETQDTDLFKFRANIIINASKGSTLEAITEMEEEYKKSIKNIPKETFSGKLANNQFETIRPNIDMESLKFYNGIRRFFGGPEKSILLDRIKVFSLRSLGVMCLQMKNLVRL